MDYGNKIDKAIRAGAVPKSGDVFSGANCGEAEKILDNYGYTIDKKIMVKDKSGEEKCTFVQATNKLGQSVYVDLDISNVNIISNTDMTMITAEKSVHIIPNSVKNGVMMTSGCESVMLDCKDGICYLTNDMETNRIEESHLIFTERCAERNVIPENNLLAYPVIRLSEIEAHPTTVLEMTSKSTSRILNNACKVCECEIEDTFTQFQFLYERMCSLNQSIQQFKIILNCTMKELNDMNCELMRIKCPTGEELCLQDRIKENLKYRYELYNELIKSCKVLTQHASEFAFHGEEIYGVDNYLKERMNGLSDDITRNY